MEINSLASGMLSSLPDRATQMVESPELKSKLDKAAQNKDDKKLMEACQDFEALLLFKMLESMRKTVPKNELTGGGMGEDIFKSMHDEALTKQMAAAGGIGLAQMLYQQLKPQGEVISVEELEQSQAVQAVSKTESVEDSFKQLDKVDSGTE